MTINVTPAPGRTGLVPVGLSLGRFPQPDGTLASPLLVAGEEVALTDGEFRVWQSSHEPADGLLPTAADVTARAVADGISDAPAIVTDLRRRRLLLDVTPQSANSFEFAAVTNLRPLAVGLGEVERPPGAAREVAVGVDGVAVDLLPPVVAEVLLFSHLDGVLLDGVRRAAAHTPQNSPRFVVEILLLCLPDLLARGAAWVDHADPALAFRTDDADE